jgi:hypothetical protein
MTAERSTVASDLIETLDVRDLNTLRWGFIRAMFPGFAEEVELGRHLRTLLKTELRAVRIEPHREPDGKLSTHVFDIRAC